MSGLPPVARRATARHQQAAELGAFKALIIALLDDPEVQAAANGSRARKSISKPVAPVSARAIRDRR